MDYSARKLADILPVLRQAVESAPAHLKTRGQNLLAASEHVTRFADLMAPFAGFGEMETLASSYIMPHIHSYLKELSGRPRTPLVLAMMPAVASAAQSTKLFGAMAKLFQGRLE